MRKLIFLILCSIATAQNPYRSFNSFNAGELSPLLSAREDLAKYQSGCSIMENLIPIPQGGAQKRPGTKYIAEVKTSSLATRIIPFEFSTSQSYIIEVGNQYMRFFTDGAPIFITFGTEDLSGIGSIVAHWLCNDKLATTAVLDDDGNTHEATANANTSTLTTTDAEGTANEAFDLQGTAYFTLANHGDFFFDDDDNEPFSLAAWVNYETTGSDQVIISKWTTIGGDAREWKLEVIGSSDKVRFQIYDESSNKAAIVTTSDALSDGWHFVVATYDGRGSSSASVGMGLYVDYVLVDATKSTAAGYSHMNEETANIGVGVQDTDEPAKIWESKIDNVAVFNKELSAADVASLTGNSSTTEVYEIITPYLTTDLFELKYEQSADVLFITHPAYETKKLSRFVNAAWSLKVLDAVNGPFLTQNLDTDFKIASSATTGSVTLSATGGAPFVDGTTAGHEPSGSVATSKSQSGSLFKLVHPLDELAFKQTLTNNFSASSVENTSWMSMGTLYKGAAWTLETTGTWTGTLEIQRNYIIGAAKGAAGWESILDVISVDDKNVTTTGTEDDGDADYRAILTASGDDAESCKVYVTTDQTEVIGIVQITSVTSPTSATGTVVRTIGSTDATYKWAEGSWSNYRGWPQTVTFFEDRLAFGGNTAQPDTLWLSVSSDYQNMTAGPDDDEALIFTLSSRQVNVIEWIIGKDKLLIGTSGAEWTIAGGTDEPLTPSNAIAKQHSTYGSANIQAGIANESILFFQRGAEKMRELAYNWELDSYVAPDMTILSNLVTRGGIVETAFQKTPDSILWAVRADGEMPIFSYERKENITAWSRMVTADGTADSDFESVARISGSPEDEVWVVVRRKINSSFVRYIEQFQPRDFGTDAADAYYVDCGITYIGGTTTVTGLGHLIGETPVVLGDGVVQTEADANDFVVTAGGEITLPDTFTTVQIGLPYEVHLRTMPLSWIAGGETIQGRQKRISEVVASWYNSGDFSVGRDTSTLQTVSIDGQTTAMDRTTFPPGFTREGYVYVYQNSPEPLTLLALMVEFDIN